MEIFKNKKSDEVLVLAPFRHKWGLSKPKNLEKLLLKELNRLRSYYNSNKTLILLDGEMNLSALVNSKNRDELSTNWESLYSRLFDSSFGKESNLPPSVIFVTDYFQNAIYNFMRVEIENKTTCVRKFVESLYRKNEEKKS